MYETDILLKPSWNQVSWWIVAIRDLGTARLAAAAVRRANRPMAALV